MSSKWKVQPVHKSSTDKYFQLPSKKLLPRTETSGERSANILVDKRNQKSPISRAGYGSTTPLIQSLKQISKRISPTPVHLKGSKSKQSPPLGLYSTEVYFGSSKQLKFPSPTSPHSIKEMNKLKEKMKLESEAKQAFLRVLSAGKAYEEPPHLNRAKSLRQFLKCQFESKYTVQYSDYFNNPQRLVEKPNVIQYKSLNIERADQAKANYSPMPVYLDPDSLIRQSQNMENIENQNGVQFLNYQNAAEQRPPQQSITNYNPNAIVSSIPNNNVFIQNDLQLQSHIKQFNEVGFDSGIQEKRMVEQIRYFPPSESIPPSNFNVIVNAPISPQKPVDYSQPEYLVYQHNPNPNPTSFHNNNQILEINAQQRSAINEQQPRSILKNSQKSNKSISFVNLNSNHHRSNQSRQYQSRISDNIEPDISQKINEYLQILDMFSSNITEFDDLLNQPNSISGIVGFYLYKRLLLQRIRLHRCLAGGSNFFKEIDFYEITDNQIREFNNLVEGKQLVRYIGDENVGLERNLKLLLDYLRRQTGKDFPKANLNLHQNFEVQLRYYLRLQVDQLKNKLQPRNLPASRNLRLTQRLVFLYQSLFLITFFNGQFIKNYQLYQDIATPDLYLHEHTQMFLDCMSQKR